MKTMKIDHEAKRVTFSDGRFYQTADGGWVPSVTTVLEAWPKPLALLQWMKEQGTNSDALLKAAGKRGSTVHYLTESYDKGDTVRLLDPIGEPVCTMEEWAMFERYVQFSERMRPKWIEVELPVVGPEYAGTIDRIGIVDGVTCIVDLKTSNGLWDTYWMQLAAYWNLINQCTAFKVEAVAILWLNAKTKTDKANQGAGWQLVFMSADEIRQQLDLFHTCVKTWHAVNDRKVPKEWSYSLEHRKA